MRIQQVLSAAVLMLVAGTVSATDRSYFSHVQLGYTQGDFEITVPGLGSAEEDDDGFTLDASFLVNDNVFIAAEITKLETEDSDVEIDEMRLGVGARTRIGGNTDLFGVLQFGKVELTIPGVGSADDDGFVITGGASINPSPQVNLFLKAGYVLFDESDGTDLSFGVSFDVAPSAALILKYRLLSLEDDFDIEYDQKGFIVGTQFQF